MLIAGFTFAGMRFHSYLNSAKTIIGSNKGEIPFSAFLKKYFSANKKYGSTDRKQITALCYNFYRLGKALPDVPVEEKIIIGTFLCESSHNDFLKFHRPEWNDLITRPLKEKIGIPGFPIEQIFPWKNKLSDGIDHEQFCSSFLDQPDLFLRIRPGKESMLTKKLEDAGLAYTMPLANCLALPNASKLDTIIEWDKDAVVQDYNSQQVLNFLKEQPGLQYPVGTWDCCAASGGKSILAFDMLKPQIDLTVSDIRESILSNLKKRFSAAGIKKYRSFLTDLSATTPELPAGSYQLIICDTPCTGSGTWGRTPEQLYFSTEEMILSYADKQEKIVTNAISQLKKNGLFIYITCSVFKKENEDMASFIKEKFHLQLLQMELLKGYDKKADTMFTAVFIKK